MEEVLEFSALPSSGIEPTVLLEAIGKHNFALVYQLSEGRTCLYVDDGLGQFAKTLPDMIPGLCLTQCTFSLTDTRWRLLSLYKNQDPKGLKTIEDILSHYFNKTIIVLFTLPGAEEADRFKSMLERLLSNRETKATSSISPGIFGGRPNLSLHTDVYKDSEERALLLSLLGDLSDTVLSAGPLFKIWFAIPANDKYLREQIVNRNILMQELELSADQIASLVSRAAAGDAFIYGKRYASSVLEICGAKRLTYPVRTFLGSQATRGGVVLGNYAPNGVSASHSEVRMDKSSLNLGFVISGLPGSGKTRETMALLHGILANGASEQTKVAVISPTNEWDLFAFAHGMNIVAANKDGIPINFFSCDGRASREKFYEDLALLISTASNSGPYKNPMEKCLLNAFRIAYSDGNSPNPTRVYSEIEKSIIRLHGRETNAGVRYTKHGENILAALENLRHILSRVEYSVTGGAHIRDLLSKGLIFNLSAVSNNTKPYMYALVLNQLYSIADTFDTDGDDKLRMLICVEEAQTIFGGSDRKDNAATEDLIRRIQDFRKRGVGIMLITHNVNDVEPGIRRICQNRMYFKQAPDMAAAAAKELVFTYSTSEDIASKLKHLDSRIAAVDFVRREGPDKVGGDSIFLRTIDYMPPPSFTGGPACRSKISVRWQVGRISMHVRITDGRQKHIHTPASLELIFLGQAVSESAINGAECIFRGVLEDRSYTVRVLSENGKQISSCTFQSKREILLTIRDDGCRIL